MKKTIEELEKELKVLFAKYFQTINKLKESDKKLKDLLSDLSLKQDEALTRNDLIDVIRANTAYMNLLSLSRAYMENIRSSKRFLESLRNTEARYINNNDGDYDGPFDSYGSLAGEKYIDNDGKEQVLKAK